ncbi:MAG TPA: hypothetical protein VIH82_08440 [Acidimicrobiia bacterium]|jgi:hypothetical protein
MSKLRRLIRSDVLPFLFVLILLLVGLGVVVLGNGPDSNECAAGRSLKICVESGTGGGGGGAPRYREVTPADSADSSSGTTGKDAHEAAAQGLATGDAGGGTGNPYNPTAAPRSRQPTHTATPPPEAPPPSVVVEVPACDPTDPHSSCYQPPCDPTDPDSPCYQPPQHYPGDVCDPHSPYYDPHAMCY